MKYFWTNTIWYLFLFFFTLCVMVFILYKTKYRWYAFAYYLTLCGAVVFFFETFVFLLFRGYDYYPMIIYNHHHPFDDDLLGKVFSQLSVSAIALFISVFDLKFPWILLLSGVYGLIEQLFLMLGIYKHHWYRTWMTVVSLIVFFKIAKVYYMWLRRRKESISHYINIFLALFPMVTLTIQWAFSLSGYQNYNASFFPRPEISRILMANTYFVIVAVPMLVIYFLKPKWVWKAAVVVGIVVLTAILYYLNILVFKNTGWLLFFSISTSLWTYFSVFLLDRWYKTQNISSKSQG